MRFMALLRVVRMLLAVGAPPAVENEVALRHWVGELVDALKAIAATSPITLDDKALDLLSTLVASETAWDIGYSLLKALLVGESGTALADKLATATCAGDKTTMIDPVTIISIVTMVVEVIKMWRSRKQ